MYYVSKETYDSLDEELKEKILQDTKDHHKMDGEDMSDEEKIEKEEGEMDYPEQAKEKEMASDLEAEEESEEKKNKYKDFDKAGDDALALMIGIGKPKKSSKDKASKEGM